ncbi:hypothetical protein [Nocardia sp. R7R-8]|uniref:hypothetical protein n=1 Tax=Nocardia sp. R7R-8 TaxID=3459304 RepID=UPI00403DA2F7
MGFDWWRNAEPDETSPQAIIDRVQAEWAAGRPAGPHDAPAGPMSVTDAHRDMQRHRGCRADSCARKAAARHTLIAAGRMVPDTSREYQR